MKKFIAAISLCLSITATSFAQDQVLKFAPIGFYQYSADGFGSGYSFQFGYERVVSQNITAQINVGAEFRNRIFNFVFGSARLNDYRLFLKPEMAYYLLNESLDGLYLGGFYTIGFGGDVGGALMGLGPQVGYQFLLLQNQLAVDLNLEIGPGFLISTDDSNIGFHSYISVSVGYAF